MVDTPSPSYYVTPFIFGFLKSIDIKSVGLRIDSVSHLLPFVKSSRTTRGEEGVAYEPFLPGSRELGVESFSTNDLLGCENVGSEQVEQSILNVDRVGDIDVDDSEDSEPILRFKRTKPTLNRSRHLVLAASKPQPYVLYLSLSLYQDLQRLVWVLL